jgi:hypothetical protein
VLDVVELVVLVVEVVVVVVPVEETHACLSFLQHQSFLEKDQPRSQLLAPAAQSYGNVVVVVHALPSSSQHHTFFEGDQPISQLK